MTGLQAILSGYVRGLCDVQREMHPPTPRPEPTVCAMTAGKIAEPAATVFTALLVVFAVASNKLDTEENSVVAEEPSSEPTAKNYGLAEESRNIAGIFGGFAVDSNNWIQGRAVA